MRFENPTNPSPDKLPTEHLPVAENLGAVPDIFPDSVPKENLPPTAATSENPMGEKNANPAKESLSHASGSLLGNGESAVDPHLSKEIFSPWDKEEFRGVSREDFKKKVFQPALRLSSIIEAEIDSLSGGTASSFEYDKLSFLSQKKQALESLLSRINVLNEASVRKNESEALISELASIEDEINRYGENYTEVPQIDKQPPLVLEASSKIENINEDGGKVVSESIYNSLPARFLRSFKEKWREALGKLSHYQKPPNEEASKRLSVLGGKALADLLASPTEASHLPTSSKEPVVEEGPSASGPEGVLPQVVSGGPYIIDVVPREYGEGATWPTATKGGDGMEVAAPEIGTEDNSEPPILDVEANESIKRHPYTFGGEIGQNGEKIDTVSEALFNVWRQDPSQVGEKFNISPRRFLAVMYGVLADLEEKPDEARALAALMNVESGDLGKMKEGQTIDLAPFYEEMAKRINK